MKIAIASDHGGYELKQTVVSYLKEKGFDYTDFGTNSEASVDYPEYGRKVGQEVAAGNFDRGIVICGTGIGIGIAANKVPGIRCALCHDVFSAKATRNHNDSNMLSMGGRVIGPGLALEIVETWLNANFDGGRHQRRIDAICDIEKEYQK
ncbi:ribose 5-phosphate isomerase B [Clostridia bacterium]|nr:ribose 5-phosphate isomerase B [Clostridia bacterium]